MLELVTTLPGHKADRVWHVAWSADGRYLASCGEDREIRIYETVVDMVKMQIDDSVFAGVNAEMKKGVDDNSGWSSEDCIRCIATLEDGQLRTIRSCEWSPNGKMIASASFDGTVVVWEAQNNAKSRWDQVSSLEGHENEVKSVAWSSDSKWLATCGRDKRVWIWERLQDNEFECVSMLDGHSQDVKFIIWHPFYSVLYSASYDDSIKVWGIDETDSSDDWRCVSTLTGHKSTVWNLAINESGNQLISCSDDCSIILWKYDGSKYGFGNWRQAAVLNSVHKLTIYSVTWSHHTGIIVTGSGDNSMSLNQIGDASIDGDGIILTIGRCEQAHSNDINCVRWNPAFQYQNILASCGDDGVIKIWIYK